MTQIKVGGKSCLNVGQLIVVPIVESKRGLVALGVGIGVSNHVVGRGTGGIIKGGGGSWIVRSLPAIPHIEINFPGVRGQRDVVNLDRFDTEVDLLCPCRRWTRGVKLAAIDDSIFQNRRSGARGCVTRRAGREKNPTSGHHKKEQCNGEKRESPQHGSS